MKVGRRSALVGAGLAVALAAALFVVLAHRAPRLAATNTRVSVSGADVIIDPGVERCQGGEYVPPDAARIRVVADAFPPGPPVPVRFVLRARDGRLLAQGVEIARARGPLNLPLPAARGDEGQASLCLRNGGDRPIGFSGNLTPSDPEVAPGSNGRGERRVDEVRATYYRPGRESWFSVLGPIAQRFARFKPGWVAPWTLWLLAAVVLATAAAAVIVLRSALGGRSAISPRRGRLLAGLPRAAVACGLLAMVNAVVWNVITPPMQGPDEIAHISYVEYVAQHARPPSLTATGGGRGAEGITLLGANWSDILVTIAFSAGGPPIWSPLEDRDLRTRLRTDPTHQSSAIAYVAVNPPLYYEADGLLDWLFRSASPLDRIFVMRLLGALLAAATVVFSYLFLREVMPNSPWAWTVGALAVAFQPDLGFLGGVIIPDTALFAASSALLFLLARCFRLGLTVRRGIAIGLVGLAGALTKGTFFGLVPGAALALAVLVRRARPRAARGLGAGAAAALSAGVPFYLWERLNSTTLGRGGATTSGVTSAAAQQRTSWNGQLSYLWQTVLPRLPGQHRWFFKVSHYPLWDVYFQGFVGRFGWFAFGPPLWADWVGLGLIVAALLAAAIGMRDGALRGRLTELGTYAAMLAGTVALVAYVGYRFKLQTTFDFEQTRYLFGLLPLWGALLACAVRPFGRWRSLAASVLVGACIVDSIAGQLIAVGHWYAFPFQL